MISAGFTDLCPCGSEIVEGDPVGLVEGLLCCVDCVREMGEDDEQEEAA